MCVFFYVFLGNQINDKTTRKCLKNIKMLNIFNRIEFKLKRNRKY